MYYQAIWDWNANDGWDFVGYAPGALRAAQMTRALNSYYLGEPRYWFGAYPTQYVVNPKAVWSQWYRMMAIGNDGRKYDYGWYTGGFTRRAVYALRTLLANSVYSVVAVDDHGTGFRSDWPNEGYYSYSDYPSVIAGATVRDAVV